MRVLVTGYDGQLGFDIVENLKTDCYTVLGTTTESMDITDLDIVAHTIRDFKPDIIVHCAAYTAVDKAEQEMLNCYTVNTVGTINIAKECSKLDIPMVYFSTDYVFDGEGKIPFEVNDRCNPINFYGFTKYLGEEYIKNNLKKYFIIRISWVYGENGNNFVKTMLKLSKTHKKVSVVSDQIGSPTFTKDVAVLVDEMIKSEKYGIYHATNEGFISWSDFASLIFNIKGLNIEVNPIYSSEYPTLAKRPLNSRLSKESLTSAGFKRLRNVEDALTEFIQKI